MKKHILIAFLAFMSAAVMAQSDSVSARSKKFSWDKLKNSRYITSDEIGGLYGIAGRGVGKMYFSYHSANGWQFNKHTYIAPGFGIELSGKNGTMVNEGNTQMSLMVPLFGEIRYSFLSKKVSPFISQKAGYSFYVAGPKPGSTIVGGGMMQTQIGFKAFITRYSAFNFSVGYRLQCLAIPSKYASQFSDAVATTPNQIEVPKTAEYYHYLAIQVGFTY